MATDASFAHSFVLKDKRPALRGVTLQTRSVRAQHRDAAALHALRQTGAAAFDCIAFVRVMTIGAAHLAFEHRVMMREVKGGAHFGVTLETGVRRFARVDDFASVA